MAAALKMSLYTVFIYLMVFVAIVHSFPSYRVSRELVHPEPHPRPQRHRPNSKNSLADDYVTAKQHQSNSYEDDLAEERDFHFEYAIDDTYNGNYQTREETKDGDRVTGSYSVMEPTGALRIVRYVADKYGFRAIVQRKWPKSGTGPSTSYTL